ncbi:MAG: hypothetical protein V1656_00085, partial [Candidatus Jorgensenbacteria bacterium]
MKSLYKNPFFYLSLVLALAVGFHAYGIAAARYVPPTEPPPEGNIAQPLDTGADSQTKQGALNVQASGSTGGVRLNENGLLYFLDVNSSPAAGVRFNNTNTKLQYSNDLSNWLDIGSGTGGSVGWSRTGTNVHLSTSTDYVGIGTDNPAEALEIVGSPARVRITSETANPELQLQYGAGANDHWGIFTNHGGTALNIWGQTMEYGNPMGSGNNIISITPLDIGSMTSAKFSINKVGGMDSQICLNGSANCISEWPQASGNPLSGGKANYVPLWTSASALGTSTIYQSTTGQIGIGTTNPLFRTDILGGTVTGTLGSTGTALRLNESASGSQTNGSVTEIGFSTYQSRTKPQGTFGWIQTSNSGSELGDFYWAATNTTTSAIAPVELMRLTSAGNVGIGTTDPKTKLHVMGGLAAANTGIFRIENNNANTMANTGASVE